MAAEGPIRVLIADDDALVREGLKVILQSDEGFEVVAVVANGAEAVAVCKRRTVDVALLDVRMPVMDGLAAAAEIARAKRGRALMLTTFDEDELIAGAMRSGARGYLLKSSPPQRIKEAIRMVAGGGTVLQDAAMDKLRDRLAAPLPGRIDTGLFSERELEVIKAIAEGLSNREIAERLFMSEGTVKNHVSAILAKTGLDHRTQIAIYYLTGTTPP
jgi:DNA-binding NarL/FixJ family response regulator